MTEWIAQNQLGPTKCLRGLDPQLLSDDTLVALTSMLLDSFPFAEDSDQSNDFTEDTEEADARRLRTHLLQSMASRGMASQLVAIGQGCPEPDLEQIRYAVREARAREALAKWQPVQPAHSWACWHVETRG
ncbi:hypothetical protein GS436_16920 [Rhodococcus hoagii]|nr:hypothetical protein [Prescottella equi]